MMKKLLLAALLLFGFPTFASAQCDGVLASGAFCGNSGASSDLAGEATPTAMFDRAFCGTANSALARVSGSWVCLASANNGVWITSAAGVPSISSTLPNAVQDNITRLGTIASITTPLGAGFGGTGLSALGTGIATWLGTPSSANLRAAMTDESGTGVLYFQGGNIGTPSAGVATNITGLPLTTGVTGQLPIANGGCNGTTAATCLNNIMPTPTRAGDVAFWNGTIWTTLAGNNSGTNVFTENSSGVPSWSAPGTGTVTNVVCGSTTITTTGTCAAPYFTAWRSANQTGVTSNVLTKIQFDSKSGTAVAQFDAATNFRFTPTLAGTYRINVNVSCDGGTLSGSCIATIYKNGTIAYEIFTTAGSSGASGVVTALVAFNGSTDYVEGFGRVTCVSACFFDGGVNPTLTWMEGVFVSP